MAACERTFIEPVREVKSPMNMGQWLQSEAYRDLLGFIMTVGESVRGKKTTDECHVSEITSKVIGLLETVSGWIDEIPPIEQPQRFGNKAYRTWHEKLVDNIDDLLQEVVTTELSGSVVELRAYFIDSFGNNTRIDYGTGHEMCFVYFLICLYKLQLLTTQDQEATVHRIFQKYLHVARKLQTTYRMEPAGSQGVWGLDDFQFVPYIWGSLQLAETSGISPEEIPCREKAEQCHSEYLLFDCVRFIHTVKSGQFAEHSNVLWGISAVKHWSKVNTGLMKMYKAEVLSKFPVIQHLVFGTLIRLQKPTTSTPS